MASEQDAASERARVLAQVAQLDLSPDRLTTLSWSLSAFLDQVRQLRAIDAGDAEPAVMLVDDEARA